MNKIHFHYFRFKIQKSKTPTKIDSNQTLYLCMGICYKFKAVFYSFVSLLFDVRSFNAQRRYEYVNYNFVKLLILGFCFSFCFVFMFIFRFTTITALRNLFQIKCLWWTTEKSMKFWKWRSNHKELILFIENEWILNMNWCEFLVFI